MLNFVRLWRSFRFASRGLAAAWHMEQNFRLLIAAAALVFIGAVWFRVPAASFIDLTLVVMIVLVLELLNTMTEKLLDLLSPRLHHASGFLKDVLAGAVLIASIGAAAVAV